MRGKLRFGWAACGLGLALVIMGRADEFEARYQAVAASRGQAPEPARLHELFTVDWAWQMAIDPEAATFNGYPGHDREWTDYSAAGVARRRALAGRALPVLATIDRARLGPADRISYDIFKRRAEEELEGARFPGEFLRLHQLDGIQQDAAQTLAHMDGDTTAKLEVQVARLRALPLAVDQVIALLEDGLRRGITPPQVTLREVPDQVRNQIPAEPFQSPLLQRFVDLPPTVPGEDGLRLRAAAAEVYSGQVRPAFERLEAFLRQKYLPAARTAIATGALPDGAAWYAWQIRTETTTDLSAQQIHEIGLAEVARIRAQMEQVMAQTGFKGTFPEFLHFLRTDPQFFFTSREDLVRAYRDIAKRADPQLMKLFKTLPRTTYGVEPMPAYAEKSQTTAYYYPSAPDTGRPGYFYANTYALHTRPKWEMEALTLHEAMPGHHLQMALAQEMAALPEFRRHGGYTAFVEGWGLYAECLGEEMGFYADPYARFGQLTYQMWRAVRLVVDTGMHALGWSRGQAIEYFMANSSKSEHDIVVEIDRYLVWPGQALAYKLGELKIMELRELATRELGARFDIRQFHDEILKNGAVPLSILEAEIKAWIASQKSG